MRILVVGAGGVGAAIAAIASRRPFFDSLVLADLDPARAERGVVTLGDPRFAAATVDAGDADAVAALARTHRSDVIVNVCDPRFNPPIFRGRSTRDCTYLDMAMTLSAAPPDAALRTGRGDAR